MNKKFIFGIILGLLLSAGIVYAADIFASNIDYDNTSSGMISDNVQDAIDELYAKASSGGGVGSSSLIQNYSITEGSSSGVNIAININGSISTTDGSDIKGYMIFANNELKTVSTQMPCSLSLEAGTEYTIMVKAVDKEGNVKNSSNSLSITTPNFAVMGLDYPVITSTGIMNAKIVNLDNPDDYTYLYDASVDCTASDALDKKAYDGDETTYADTSSGKIKFRFGNDIDIYYVSFKISGSSGYIFYAVNSYSGNINVGGESKLYDGYYHTTYYGKGTPSWRNYMAAIGNNTYEIKYDSTIP